MHCSMFGLPEPVGELLRNENNAGNHTINPNLLNIEQREAIAQQISFTFIIWKPQN